MRLRLAPLVALLVACAAAAGTVPPAEASRFLRVGIFDDARTLHGPPERAFAQYAALRAQVVRVTLAWGGRDGVARARPLRATDPADRAYDWSRYDRTVRLAAARRIKVLFAIYGTPAWAGGRRGANVAPASFTDLRDFAYAAARRYSGSYRGADGRVLPAVRDWLAWNEPNNPVFLSPQFRRAGGRWVVQSAVSYAGICNAVYEGIHATLVRGERVACGATAPRGNDDPGSTRPSVSPIAFLRAAKAAGLRTFEAWAHHPHASSPAEASAGTTVGAAVPGGRAVTISNIGSLTSVLRQLYGNKRLWLTEYGVQTNPPDPYFGVTLSRQAAALRHAYAVARAHPQIDVLVWFLLVDEADPGRWQSGLLTLEGKRKPAFAAFAALARAGPPR